MNIGLEFVIGFLTLFVTILLQGMSSAKTFGRLEEKVNELGKKQDKHNGLIERMVKVESSAASAHHRLDELNHKQEDMEHNCQKILRGRLNENK